MQRRIQRGRAQPLYHGWVMIGTLALTELVSWGVTYYAFSVLMPPMQHDLGWSSAQLAGAFSLGLLIAGLSEVWVGRWLDARGPRVLMTLGSILAVGMVLAWSQVQTVLAFYAVWVGMGLVGPMVQYAPAFWIATRWFTRKRGLALTLITLGGGFASTVFIPLTHVLEAVWGWRLTLMALAGILALATILPHAALLRDVPARMGVGMDSDQISSVVPTSLRHDKAVQDMGHVLRQRQFWILALAFAFSNITFTGMSVHLLSYELSRGQDPAFAAWAAGFVGVMQVAGRLFLAPLSDRMPRKQIATFLFMCQTVSLLALLLLPLATGLIAHAVLRGIGNGTLTPLRAALIGDAFGTERYGSISGTLSSITGLAGAISPVAVGAIAGTWGYTPVLWMFAGMALLAGILVSRVQLTRQSDLTDG